MKHKELKEIFVKTADCLDLKTYEEKDIELKKILALDFFYSLFEGETIQAEYETKDIALIVLFFWENENREYTERRIQEVLHETINDHYFIHYGKVLPWDKAYEFVLKGVLEALEKNYILREAFSDLHQVAYSKMNKFPHVPMTKRNRFGLLSVIDSWNEIQDPALEHHPTMMN